MFLLVYVGAIAVLFLLGVDFLALMFLLVYVGAIAVLFLFVVMFIKFNRLSSCF